MLPLQLIKAIADPTKVITIISPSTMAYSFSYA
jgi:hypothetical protein